MPAPLPSGDENMTKEAIQKLVPPGIRVVKDFYNGRWQFFWKFSGKEMPVRSVSRSWGDRTSREAVKSCLRRVWKWAMAEGIECPLSKLYDGDTSGESSAE